MILDQEIIAELRKMRMAGSLVSEMIGHLKEQTASPPDSSMLIVYYFKEAFCLSLQDVLPVQGCAALGRSAYTNDEINELLGPKIEQTRDLWSD